MFKFTVALASLALYLTPLAAGEPVILDVWPGKPPSETGDIGAEKVLDDKPGARKVMRITNVTRPTLSVFRPAAEKNTGTAVLICPGGGYNILAWDLEGEEVAKWLNSLGVTGIVLKYRVPRRSGQSGPPQQALQDAQRAMSLIRGKAKEWGIQPERIGILGFSAGGHLTVATATNFDKRAYEAIDDTDKVSCRPDFAIPIYPAYLLSKDGAELASEIHVSKETPPMFLVHAHDDGLTAENSARLYIALKRAKVGAELHIYSSGGHGFGLRPGSVASATWPDRCADWMKAQKLLDR